MSCRTIEERLNIVWEWEIQAAFFKSYSITPHWINCNYTWGTLNYTTGQWSGAVGLIQRDEVDYAIPNFAGTYGRSKVAAFSPGINFHPYHWLTRYPLELTPMWNLLGLFTKVYNSPMSKLNLIWFSNKFKKSYLWIFLSVCVDVDFLLHVVGFYGIYYIIKNIQENVSRNETKFKWSRTDTFQVCLC